MIRQIAPEFFTTNIPDTLAYYKDKLGFECVGTWQDPPTYAIVARDQHAIHFRCAEPPTANPDKYADELLDAYLFVEDADALLCRVCSQRRRVHSGTWQHALALARVCREGLRRPSAGLRLELIE
jgi:catechol 2,3-dioxygenase-like lactoylglutathione lyase family enzyme